MPFGFYLLVSDAYPDGCFVLGRKAQSFQVRRVLPYELNPRASLVQRRTSLFSKIFFILLLVFSAFTLPLSASQRGVKRVEIKTPTGELVGLYE